MCRQKHCIERKTVCSIEAIFSYNRKYLYPEVLSSLDLHLFYKHHFHLN